MTATKDAFVEHTEKGVQDRGRAEKDLVEKRDLGLGQHACSLGLDDAFTQLAKFFGTADRAALGCDHLVFRPPAGARDI